MNVPPIDRDDLILALTAADELEQCTHYLDSETGAVIYAAEGIEDLPPDLAHNPRYLLIEPLPAAQLLRLQADFVEQLDDAGIAAWLRKALQADQPGPAFKLALQRFPAQRAAWFRYQHDAHEALADAWCRAHGLLPGRPPLH